VYRETKAWLRKRVKLLGVEGGVLPLAISGFATMGLLAVSYAHTDGGGEPLPRTVVSLLPCVLTYSYLWIFKTGRRPHFDRDLLYALLYGKAVSPLPPSLQPVHPVLGRRAPRVT
jgi:hypothetical protein